MGSGKPLRQFCFAADLCHLILWALFQEDQDFPRCVALLPEEEHSIKDLALTIASLSDIPQEKLLFDDTKADG